MSAFPFSDEWRNDSKYSDDLDPPPDTCICRACGELVRWFSETRGQSWTLVNYMALMDARVPFPKGNRYYSGDGDLALVYDSIDAAKTYKRMRLVQRYKMQGDVKRHNGHIDDESYDGFIIHEYVCDYTKAFTQAEQPSMF